jgi:pantoate--beta-alanine ligase
MVALSSRNSLLNQKNLNTLSSISKRLTNFKKKILLNKNKSKKLMQIFKKELVKEFNIKIEYLECRNIINLSTNIKTKPFKIFIAYYLKNVRLIDNF